MNWINRRRCQELLVLTPLLLSLAAIAQSAAPPADTNSAAETEVKTFIAKLAEMIVRGDWDGYAQRLAPDYFHTSHDGRVENRDEALTSLRDPQRKIIVMEVEPGQSVRLYDDTAVSSAEFTISIREAGHLKTRRLRITHVLVKREGHWSLVAEHATAIGK
jgi:ketosteroid isomerase-like protein